MVFLFVIVHRFCCLHSRPPQGRGSVRGEPLTGSPTRVQSPARRRRGSLAALPRRDTHTGTKTCRGSTRYRHPTNGRAIRRSPAGPLDLTRCAQVEAASSSLPAAFQKENTILTDGVSFCDCPQVLLSALPPTARKGECEGGTFDGFPYSRSITRPQATRLARGAAAPRHAHGHQNVPGLDSLPASHEWQSHSQEPCRTS